MSFGEAGGLVVAPLRSVPGIVFVPGGPAGAHLVRNNSEETARVAMFSSSGARVGAVVYPDSDLVWVWTAATRSTWS
jgi:hypothetical protein